MTSTTYTNGHAFLCIHCMWGRCDLNLFDQHVTKLPYLESAILFVKSLVGGVAGLIRGHPKRHYWHTWVRRCHSLTTLCEREVRSVILTLLGMLGMSQEYKHQNERKSWRQKKKNFQPATCCVSLAKGRSIGSNASPCLLQGGYCFRARTYKNHD